MQEFAVPVFDLQNTLKGAPTMSHEFPVSYLHFNHDVVQVTSACDETALPEACASPWSPQVPYYFITNIPKKTKSQQLNDRKDLGFEKKEGYA